MNRTHSNAKPAAIPAGAGLSSLTVHRWLLLIACLFAAAPTLQAVIFGVDAFDYPDGPVAGQTGGVSWDRTNAQFFSPSGGPSNWDNVSNAPTVFFGRLVTNNSAAKREYKGSPEADGAVNDGTFAKAVYYRATVTTGPVVPEFMVVSSYDFGNERIFFGKRFGAANFGIGNAVANTFSDSSIPVQPNTTYVLVARVDYNDTPSGNTLRLYVNPDLTAAEPATASASLAWTNTEWSTAVRLASGFSGSAVTWDDITVATSWGDLALVVNSAPDVDHGALGGTQSLRDCLKYGAKGSTILFAPALNGATISLTNALGEIAVTSGQDFIVDASALSNGITINKGGASDYRLLQVNSGARLEVRGVTFANAGASADSIEGGAVRNQGALTLTRCTLSGNSAGSGSGGAIYNGGSLLVHQCALSGNSAAFGGALDSVGPARLAHTTIAGNTAAFGGGLRNNQVPTTLLHCTVSDNTATSGAGGGGGVASRGVSAASTLVRHSIISGNAGGDVDFIGGAVNSFTSQGRNLIGTGGATGAFNQTGDVINNLDPLLMPLGSYGGRTRTMPPLAGSPAIDSAAAITNLDADQRGFARNRDGNNDGNFSQDIGAVEAVFRFVTSDLDAGTGSLRQALLDAAATPGWEAIAFDQSLDDGTISLTSFALQSAISVNDAGGVSIDATGLASGLTITKPSGNYRLFNVNASLTMHRLILTNGAILSFGAGGALLNSGTLTLTECTLSGNSTGGSSGSGGAIYNSGTLALTQCTLSDNSADAGGAIYHSPSLGTATFTRCTFSGNRATGSGGGGAIYNRGPLTLNQCTVSANANTSGSGGGGGIVNFFDTQLTLNNTIVAGNTASSSADISNLGTVTRLGTNIVQSPAGGTINGSGTILTAVPLLAPLGDYGGHTQTMPPRPGSPALDAAAGPVAAADQRGFPLNRDGDANGVAAPDVGAVEASIVAVTTNQDAGAGSLRQAIADAAALPGADTILFSQSLGGGTISLTTSASGTALTVNDEAGVTIDASTLTNGLTLTKPAGNYRLFYVTGGTLALDSLTLTGGTSGDGGAMINVGTTTLTRCTLTGHTGSITAGAVLNIGTFKLDRCTVSGNAGVRGGGLYNEFGATMNVVNSTITANTASNTGGGIFNAGTLSVRHATISENKSDVNAGGIHNDGTLTLGNSIVAGNYFSTPTGRNDMRGSGTFTTQGGNLLGSHGSVLAGAFPAGLPNANNDFVGSDSAPLDPRLHPLGRYNGPTQTMPPLAGSRAVDGGINFGLDTIDQRGRARTVDGNNTGGAQPDSGAVEAAFRFVTTNGYFGPGSLRQALFDAAAAPGWESIAFVSGLDGGVISLTSSFDTSGTGPSGITVADDDGVAIDATSLSGGLTITKPAGDYRLFLVNNGSRLSLHGLTLIGGSLSGHFGGAIYNTSGILRVHNCTFTGNQAIEGGAIYSDTLGATFTEIQRCTFTSNTATDGGGSAVRNNVGQTTVSFSTISGNSAAGPDGGAITSGLNPCNTVVTSSIISGNTGGDVVFLSFTNTNSFTSQGHNLIGTGNATGAFMQPGDVINNPDPLLAPLDHYGGPTRTMALRPGSPARDTGSAAAFDQRGFTIFGTPDKGAYESGTLTNYNAFIWETLPTTATVPEHAATFDFDGDGATNEGEFLAGTVVTNPASVFRVKSVSFANGEFTLVFPTVPGRTYRVEESTDLTNPAAWTLLPGTFPGTGGDLFLTITPPANTPRYFLRPRVGP